ncbi:uncharacterized protein PFLUO_LOCUS2768 [Penicillium psychrofluorescens]|uniref:uncharacterized protein n=1 Tax=Penicillium psychrofluorescens TaxID=3158075 RepID=UPI003CCD7E93
MAVMGIVAHLEMTRNQIVYVREADVSQKQLLRLAGDQKVEMKEVRTDDLERQGYAEVQKEKPDWRVATQCFLRRAIFGEDFGSHFEEGRLANRLVGVRQMTEAELRGLAGKYSK